MLNKRIMAMSIALLVLQMMMITSVLCTEVCPKCGDMDVPYPLSTQKDCGLSSYSIHCNDNVLQFKSVTGFYYNILNINTNTNKVVIGVPKISSESCYSSDLMDGGLKLDESSPFNISTHNTVLLLNCSRSILRSPLNCSSNSVCRLFELEEEAGRGCRGTLCCSYLKDSSMTAHLIRVRMGGCTAYTSIVDLKSGNESDPASWNYGIELQWIPPTF